MALPIALVLGCGGGGGDGDSPDAGGDAIAPNEHDYTIDSFEYVDPNPEAFHPLGEPNANMLTVEEVATIVETATEGGTVDDDPRSAGTLGTLPIDPNAGVRRIYARVTANLDADGSDELVIAQLETATGFVRIRILDSAPMNHFYQERTIDIDTAYEDLVVAAADVDHDGKEELVVAMAGDTNAGVVRLYDDLDANLASLGDIATVPAGVRSIGVAVGDFDGDGSTEFATATTAHADDDLVVSVRDDIDASFAILGSHTAAPFRDGDFLNVARLELHGGNFDDDSDDEMVLVADASDPGGNGASGVRHYLVDDQAAAFAVTDQTGYGDADGSFSGYFPVGNRWPWRSVAADLNGDQTLELIVSRRNQSGSGSNYEWLIYHEPMPAEEDAWTSSSGRTISGADQVSLLSLDAVADKTGADDVADEYGDAVAINMRSGAALSQARLAPTLVDAQALPQVWDLAPLTSTTRTVPSTDRPPWIAAGDFDADSLRLRYTGNKSLALADPMPIAVLAAPPTISGIDQKLDQSSTAYGTTVSMGSMETHEIGVTTRTTFTTTASIPKLGIDLLETERNLDERVSSTTSTTETVTYGSSFRGASEEDAIVFQGTLYNSYEYEVVGALDPTEIGQKLRIDVPIATRVYKWTIPFFNEALVDIDWAIDSSVLGHTPGDPSTYPTVAMRDSALAAIAGWQSLRATVGQGNGSVEVSLDLATEMATTEQRARSNQTTLRGPLNNFLCELDNPSCESHGFADSKSYTVTLGSSTHYSGAVGDIVNTDVWTARNYDFGLFVYWHTMPNGVDVQVVNYWVE